jgi:NAD-dependent dihydropyrimidine dehydrogenase PreA subunit
MSNVYKRLQAHLDNMVSGFPATESGVEIRLLKKLFEEEEAEFFLKLLPLLETPEAIAERMDAPANAIADRLESMATRGLLFRYRKGGTVKYAAVPYVVGLFEFQLNRLTEDIAKDMEAYFFEAFGKSLQAYKTPLMRTVPINSEISAKWPVAPYDDVLGILESQKTIALAPCICRKTTDLVDKACDKPQEACLLFGTHADYYVENGLGRYVSADEAKAVAARSEEAGLVMQPFNSQKVGGMCSCCGCCCGMLRSLKMQPSPAESVQSNYFAAVNEDECNACETCIERCQMDAITMEADVAVVDRNRCIGCGLCVTTCPTEAIFLEKKEEAEQYVPPRTGMETYLSITAERGKL